jgi:inositol oxygenase
MKKLCLLVLITIHISQITSKPTEDFRNYEHVAQNVKDFYLANHTQQTFDFVIKKKQEYSPLNKLTMSIWDAMYALDKIVDESDPDLDNAQSVHSFQTAERLRKDGHPRWLILVGLIHDLGKVLVLFGEQQWAVVGDTFPVGCSYSDKVILPDYFKNNPDMYREEFQTQYGIYWPHCGLGNVHMSWGHDEYLYYVTKNYLPNNALYVIRYHSFYAAHKEEAYDYLMNDYDRSMMPLLKLFSNYDLYSKSPEPVDVSELMPFYQELIAEYFPQDLNW